VGFLIGDTSNILLDAVLTDKGRQAISRNDGSFSIVKFAVGDEEVDYGIIKKYGRTVGKEKIEKNTPIFEALTNQQFAQKYRLVSISNPNLIRMPRMDFSGEGVDTTNRLVSIGNTTVKRRTLSISQTIQDETSIDVELRDQAFIVDMNNQLLQIIGSSPDSVDGQQRATYILTRDSGETSVGGSRLTFTIATKAITESQFQILGASFNKNLISTFVKISGVQSGTVLEFEVRIEKTA
jgi:hypothetical protein